MKITFVISQLGGGGAERVVSLISGKLFELGHEVSLITLIKQPIVYPLSPGVRLIELNCRNSRITGTLKQVKILREKYKELRPDIIISFLPVVNMTAILAKQGLNSKIIVSERNDPYQNPRKKIIRILRDFLYHFSDGFVFQTPDAMDYFGEYARKKGTVIANPICVGLPKPFCGERTKRFVTAVRLEPQKNLDMLIEAFSMLSQKYPEYRLEIYGDGGERERLEQKCAEMSLTEKIIFKGFSKNLYSDILDAAAFVLPSNYEGLSNSMLEALAMGIPVISTDHPIGGARMFIRDGVNGLLTKVGDTNEMYIAMKKLIENPELAASLSAKAKEIRLELSVDTVVGQWYKFIEKVCKGNE